MDADVRGDMVAFYGGSAAGTPLTGKVEVVGALATDMAFADVILAISVNDVLTLRIHYYRDDVYLHIELLHCRIALHSLATGM